MHWYETFVGYINGACVPDGIVRLRPGSAGVFRRFPGGERRRQLLPGRNDRFDDPDKAHRTQTTASTTYARNSPAGTYEYVSTKEQSLEEIVDALVKLYLEDMMTPRDNKSSPVTEYRNLSVDIQSPDEVDNDIHRKVYPQQWVCYITFKYHYEGICSPHGPPARRLDSGRMFRGLPGRKLRLYLSYEMEQQRRRLSL